MENAVKANWIDEFDLEETLAIAAALARRHAVQAGPYSEELTSLIDSRDYAGLLGYTVDYSRSKNVVYAMHARQSLGYFEKLEPLGDLLGIPREQRAWEKFQATEVRCCETNRFFRSLVGYQFGAQVNTCLHPDLDRILHTARGKVQQILGKAPKISALRYRLGPGATTATTKRNACPAEKLSAPLACSPALLPYLPIVLGEMPHLAMLHNIESEEYGPTDRWLVNVRIDAGKLEFVPKDAESYRAIVKTPALSGLVQNAIGDVMREPLARAGISIRDQTRNQNLAKFASETESLTTLDLKSASDLCASELVRFLMPEDWWELFSCCRDSSVEYEGKQFSLEKFSSMGNGFTFPLESLIFFAITWAASQPHERGWVSAYGDDIICSTASTARVVWALEACGFLVNPKKSFWEGPFRESCGADYLYGIDIRPYRQKLAVSGKTLFTLHNFYRRRFDDDEADFVISLIHPSLRIYGPDGYGDGHLVVHDPRPHLRPRGRKDGWGGWTFRTFVARPRSFVRVHPGDYVHLLYSHYVSENLGDAHEYTQYSTTKPLHFLMDDLGNGEYIEDIPPKSRDGRVVKTLPGSKEYVLKSIYTLG